MRLFIAALLVAISYAQTECTEDPTWKDRWGDPCSWYEAQIERCMVYGNTNEEYIESAMLYSREAMDECCYCKPGPLGGPAANEGRFCTQNTEDSIVERWMVDLGAHNRNPSTIYKDCWWFEQDGGRCRKSWGDVVGSGGKTANEVCCVCKFGRVVNHWGRNVYNDGSPALSKEEAVGEEDLIDGGDAEKSSSETKLAQQNSRLRETNQRLKKALNTLLN